MKEIKETKEDPVKKQLGLLVQGLPLSLTQQNVSVVRNLFRLKMTNHEKMNFPIGV